MGLINDFLRFLGPETRELLYSVFNILFAVTFSILFLILVRGAKKLPLWKSAVILVLPYATQYVIMLIGGLIKTAFAPILEVPTYYPVYFIPIMHATVLLVSLIARLDFRDIADRFILALFFARPFVCLACLSYGCCFGAEAEWGIVSHLNDKVVPLRAFELVIFIILAFLNRRYYKRGKFKYKGQCAAVGTIEFGGIIFLFDIFAASPAKAFGFISSVGVAALVAVAVGLIMLMDYSEREKIRCALQKKHSGKKSCRKSKERG